MGPFPPLIEREFLTFGPAFSCFKRENGQAQLPDVAALLSLSKWHSLLHLAGIPFCLVRTPACALPVVRILASSDLLRVPSEPQFFQQPTVVLASIFAASFCRSSGGTAPLLAKIYCHLAVRV